MLRYISTMVVVALAVTAASTSAFASSSDNYGGNSKKEQRQMEQMIRAKFPAYIESTMVCIARRESGLNPRAVNWADRHSNGRGSFGLFQIGRIHDHYVGFNYRKLWDAQTNVNVAYRIWKGSGLGPWGGGC